MCKGMELRISVIYNGIRRIARTLLVCTLLFVVYTIGSTGSIDCRCSSSDQTVWFRRLKMVLSLCRCSGDLTDNSGKAVKA